MIKNQNILHVQNLTVQATVGSNRLKIIDNLSFSVKRGEIFGLVGESGCGKSTTGKAIIQLLADNEKITSGKIEYFTKNNTPIDIVQCDFKTLRSIRGNEIGMIFQNPMTALNPVVRIKEQIYEQFQNNKSLSTNDKKTLAVNILKKVGITSPEHRLNQYIFEFSGGMKQRAMIATVLAANPQFLIADEPTTALDVTIQTQIIKLLVDIQKDFSMSILMISHDLGVIKNLCDTVAVMYGGYLVEIAKTNDIFLTPLHYYTKGLINSLIALPYEKKVQNSLRLDYIPGHTPSLTERGKGCPFYLRCQNAKEFCKNNLPELKEITTNHFCRCHFLKDEKNYVRE